MRSTSGGAITWGWHTLKAWSSTQAVLALSSAEAELYAMTKAASVATGIVSMAADFGEVWTVKLLGDSSAAMGIAYRQGLGKVRHLDVQQLWIQQKVLMKKIKLEKVAGTSNVADMMTKYLASDSMEKIVHELGFEYTPGRAASAPKMSKDVEGF